MTGAHPISDMRTYQCIWKRLKKAGVRLGPLRAETPLTCRHCGTTFYTGSLRGKMPIYCRRCNRKRDRR